MAGKNRERYEKRLRERAKQEKAAAKREQRDLKKRGVDEEGNPIDEDDSGPSEADLLEQFRVLSESHAAGELEDDTFEQKRAELMEALGFG